jgi:hypothetical protein
MTKEITTTQEQRMLALIENEEWASYNDDFFQRQILVSIPECEAITVYDAITGKSREIFGEVVIHQKKHIKTNRPSPIVYELKEG